MFGEFESESPRVPSPWDSLTPPSSPPKHNGIPKLVPEADEGNVEYKLQLLSPTPARFARLVTQLKWRLLEGGGQAYYELGVADSGILVGLPRHQLEESLETLEMMAGEIGASVIVVKEIEVPPELSSFAQSQIEKWDGKRSTRRKDLLRIVDESLAVSPAEPETEPLNTDTEGTRSSPVTPPALPGSELFIQPVPSPDPFPFDPALAMFTVDVGDYVTDSEAPDDDVYVDCGVQCSVNIEISSVYKPRPMKKRAIHIAPPQPTYVKSKKKLKNGHPPSKSTDDTCRTRGTVGQNSGEDNLQPDGGEAQTWRDRQQAATRLAAPTPVGSDATLPSPRDETSQLATEDPPAADTLDTATVVSQEPRLIVEVLVVRKLSLSEVFLDFEGFSLQ